MSESQNVIILSTINDDISLPISKFLEVLYKEDYKSYKKLYITLASMVYDFSCDVQALLERYGYEN